MHPLIAALGRTIGFNPLAWFRDTRRMRELVVGFDVKSPPRANAIRFAVVLTPWLGTAVPWFSLVCGLFLASSGNKVSFIVDDLPFGRNGMRFRFVLCCMGSVLRLLRRRHEIIHLSDRVSRLALNRAAQQSVDHLAELNAVWALRGEMSESGRQQQTARAARQLGASYGAIAAVLQGGPYDVLFVPGGVWGSSGIWSKHARSAGLRLATYDSGGYGTMMLAVNGIACQLQDIPRAFSMLKTHATSSAEHAFIVESAFAEIGRRRSGVDRFVSQIPGTREVEARLTGAVLVALNSSWDSAALGLHAVFGNSTQWLVETTKYLLDNTSAPVIVRQHPVERLESARTSDDYQGLLAHHFGDHPRLHFIAADEVVNSYDLLEKAVAVVVYTSTIGIEAAVHGKPVVTPSRSYYSDLGFVWKSTSLTEYQQHLLEAVSGRSVVTPAMRNDALCCYYLTQCCNWLFSPFSPESFEGWSRLDLAELFQQDKVQATVMALEQDVPIAFLNHLTLLEHQSRQ